MGRSHPIQNRDGRGAAHRSESHFTSRGIALDRSDSALFGQCFAGANNPPAPGCPPGVDADLDHHGDVDPADYALFARNFTGAR